MSTKQQGASEDMSEGNEGQAAPRGSAGRVPLGLSVAERFDDEREAMDRDQTENREVSEDERLEMFMETQHQTVLPNLPVMPGYHVCWLTTSNPRDSIPWRLSIGYELLRRSECPTWRGIGQSVSGFDDVVCVNEMVAARVPLTLYNKFMREVGHRQPLREEEKLRSQTDEIANDARRKGVTVQEGEGTAEIVQRAGPMPVFDE